jgi:hypothetical protein
MLGAMVDALAAAGACGEEPGFRQGPGRARCLLPAAELAAQELAPADALAHVT